MNRTFYITSFLLFVLWTPLLLGQTTNNRVPLTQVKQQEAFIEAQREKLLGNYEKAEEKFRSILETNSNDASIYFSFAQVLSKLDKDAEAIQMAEKASQLARDNEWYQVYLTEIYEKNGKDRSAAEVYENLVKDNPDNYDYYNSWAFYLIRAQAIDEAIDVYNLLEKKIGVSESTTRKKHTLYLGKGDIKKAGKELENLATAFPKQIAYQHLLAAFYQQFDQPEKAKTVYQNILQQSPNDATALLALKGGSTTADDAYGELKTIFERSDIPVDAKLKELLPLLQKAVDGNDSRQLRATLQLAEVLVNAHPNEAKVHAAYGDLLFHSQQFKKARTAYERTLEIDESVYLVWEQLLYIYWQQQDYGALADRSEEAIDLFPNQSQIYLFHAIALYNLEEYEDAIDILQEASFMVGNELNKKAEIYQQLAITYQRMGNVEQSDKHFDQAIAWQPKSISLLNTYAYTLAERGTQLPKAVALIEQAQTLAPNAAFLADTHAFILYQKGDYKKARKQIERAITQEERALYFEHYGDILLALGEKELAVTQWKRAQSLGADVSDKIAEQLN
ncbi:MAG: tetratricopeptide repeat protein [Bacteroidota bacterium]